MVVVRGWALLTDSGIPEPTRHGGHPGTSSLKFCRGRLATGLLYSAQEKSECGQGEGPAIWGGAGWLSVTLTREGWAPGAYYWTPRPGIWPVRVRPGIQALCGALGMDAGRGRWCGSHPGAPSGQAAGSADNKRGLALSFPMAAGSSQRLAGPRPYSRA